MKNYLEIIGSTAILGVISVALKLIGVIDVSWWGVTFPFWWWLAIGAIGLVMYGVLYLIGSIIKNKQR